MYVYAAFSNIIFLIVSKPCAPKKDLHTSYYTYDEKNQGSHLEKGIKKSLHPSLYLKFASKEYIENFI